MRSMARRMVLPLIVGSMVAAVGGAEEWVLELDPQDSKIAFQLGATLHTVEGTAALTAGEVRLDPATGAASGRIQVDVASLDTGNDWRDEDMHSKVLESSRYRDLYFEVQAMSGAFDPEGESRLKVDGRFGIHGEEHALTLEVDIATEGDRLQGFSEFEVPYVEWGMMDPSKFLLRVDKHVTVQTRVVGRLLPSTPQDTPSR